MIKPSDLRRGNIVCYSGQIDLVDEISLKLIHTKRFSSLAPEIIDPVTITPEWLNRLHIKSTDKENHFLHHWKGFYFKLEKVGNGYFLKSSAGTVESKALTYVHQVQNLYNALTGTELELKPE